MNIPKIDFISLIYLKYVVKAELSKLTFAEDKIIHLNICDFSSKSKLVQYTCTIFKTALLYLLKFIRLYEHQQETKVPFIAIFGTLSLFNTYTWSTFSIMLPNLCRRRHK